MLYNNQTRFYVVFQQCFLDIYFPSFSDQVLKIYLRLFFFEIYVILVLKIALVFKFCKLKFASKKCRFSRLGTPIMWAMAATSRWHWWKENALNLSFRVLEFYHLFIISWYKSAHLSNRQNACYCNWHILNITCNCVNGQFVIMSNICDVISYLRVQWVMARFGLRDNFNVIFNKGHRGLVGLFVR